MFDSFKYRLRMAIFQWMQDAEGDLVLVVFGILALTKYKDSTLLNWAPSMKLRPAGKYQGHSLFTPPLKDQDLSWLSPGAFVQVSERSNCLTWRRGIVVSIVPPKNDAVGRFTDSIVWVEIMGMKQLVWFSPDELVHLAHLDRP